MEELTLKHITVLNRAELTGIISGGLQEKTLYIFSHGESVMHRATPSLKQLGTVCQ